MSVVTRLGGWLVAAGVVVGLAMRLVLGRRRFGLLLAWALALPWLLHAGYVSVRALTGGFSAWGVAAFLAVGAGLTVAAVMTGRRLTRARGLLAALMPAALGVAYGMGPFLLLSLALMRAGIDLDIVPTAAYAGACAFATAVLLPFAPRAAAAPAGSRRSGWPRRRR